jgi:hypothetical protein
MNRYIDADKLTVCHVNVGTVMFPKIEDYVRAKDIENAITTDVVEVVRCKDCKYLYCLSAIDRQFNCRHYPQGLHGINIIEDNPYCSYGERREENEG